jgi:hypothetical protein
MKSIKDFFCGGGGGVRSYQCRAGERPVPPGATKRHVDQKTGKFSVPGPHDTEKRRRGEPVVSYGEEAAGGREALFGCEREREVWARSWVGPCYSASQRARAPKTKKRMWNSVGCQRNSLDVRNTPKEEMTFANASTPTRGKLEG